MEVISYEVVKERLQSGYMESQNIFRKCSRWLGEFD
jgi:hypothetical protein